MGFWDVLLFNIAAVLGPRWVAAAAHNGTSSISLWILAAIFFFIPTALVIIELSTRFPSEGGLYVWSKEAFGEFHGFVAGWTYWVYTFFYFPGLLFASASMSAYIGGAGMGGLAQNHTFLVGVSLVLLFVAVVMNIIGLNIGKWLQNAGGVGTYIPLLMLIGAAAVLWHRHGSVTQFTWTNILPHWNWDTVNFWPQIAFAFVGLELVSAMSEEIRDPKKTLPRAIYGSGALIAIIYIVATVAVLADSAERRSRSQERRVPGAHGRIHNSENRRVRHDRRVSRFHWQCRRRGHHRRGNRANSVRGRRRSLYARRIRKNSSAMADAVHFDSRAGGNFRGGAAGESNQ